MIFKSTNGTLYYKPEDDYEPVTGEIIAYRVTSKADPLTEWTRGQWYIVERVLPQEKE